MRKAFVVVAVATLGVAAMLAAWLLGPDRSPKLNSREACVAAFAGMPDAGPWRVALESGRWSGFYALDDGRHVAVCEAVGPPPDLAVGWRASGAAAADSAPASPQPLTYDVDQAVNAVAVPGLAAGRVPAGTVSVRLVIPGGSTFLADVGGGVWIAWVADKRPVAVEALDASGTVIGRISDAAGLRPRSSLTPGGTGANP